MQLNISEILFGFSTALDAVEGEVVGATSYHAQRVAYMSSIMARHMGLPDESRLCLAVAAALHDNALTQYVQGEIKKGEDPDSITIEKDLGAHCIMGEENIKSLTIYEKIKDAVLYHHECADRSGPFNKTAEETPLFARIIHICDRVDVRLNFYEIDEIKFNKVREFVKSSIGTYFDKEVAEAFLSAVTFDRLDSIAGNKIVATLYEELPQVAKEYTLKELTMVSDMFAKIIDFKSPFTTRHSMGIAQKAKMMGEFYGWDEETITKLYFAGAVHDVGKLFVDNELLEKPGKLTAEEFALIQDHATGTYVVLNSIQGIDDITSWASLHHEKLDGSGYPFKKTAADLGKKERLMACLDIYQALVEPRPYKDGMSHEKAMSILYSMVENGQLDEQITKDIDERFKDWVEETIHQ